MEIRPATEADWPQIYPIFAAIVAEGRTYAYPDGLTSEQARSYWMGDPGNHVVVAVTGGAVAGTAWAGPNRPGRGAHVATASFMVDPGYQGRGAGRALGEYIVAWCAAQGFRSIQFNAVVETNQAAVALWRKLGFGIIGTVPRAFDHPEHGLVGLHVMYREL